MPSSATTTACNKRAGWRPVVGTWAILRPSRTRAARPPEAGPPAAPCTAACHTPAQSASLAWARAAANPAGGTLEQHHIVAEGLHPKPHRCPGGQVGCQEPQDTPALGITVRLLWRSVTPPRQGKPLAGSAPPPPFKENRQQGDPRALRRDLTGPAGPRAPRASPATAHSDPGPHGRGPGDVDPRVGATAIPACRAPRVAAAARAVTAISAAAVRRLSPQQRAWLRLAPAHPAAWPPAPTSRQAPTGSTSVSPLRADASVAFKTATCT